MTKEELEQYRSIVAEIDEIRERLNKNTVHGTVTGSDSEFPYVKHCITVGGFEQSSDVQRSMIRIQKLECRKRAIEDFIENILDSELRRIIIYKYIKGPYKVTWMAVVKKMYPKLSPDKQFRMKECIKQKVSRFFKNL